MLKSKKGKMVITIILIISLIYANFNMAILGMISYALDEKSEIQNGEEIHEEKELEIEISDFAKNSMNVQETEYEEKVKVKLEKNLKEVVISDINTAILNKVVEEETAEENIKQPDIFYKATVLNKAEIINQIGTSGSIEITYKQLLPETENSEANVEKDVEEGKIILPVIEEQEQSKKIVLPEVEEVATNNIYAENGKTIINSETIADENDNITIIYPEKTYSIEIKILPDNKIINELNIKHIKTIGIIEDVENLEKIEITKQIVAKEDDEVLNIQETASKNIEYTKTVAELGIDKLELSTEVENKVNFTITMHTNKLTHDLYKNPYFVIELPNIINKVNLETLTIINNPYFEIGAIEEGILENGNRAISIKLTGEQAEHTISREENIQLILETTIETNDLIPTQEGKAILYYQNEIATTYGATSEVVMKFIANKEIIVESKAIAGENIISSPRANYNTLIVEPNTYSTVTITGMAINNTGKDIKNAIILGTATNVGPIAIENAIVYYTNNENATIDVSNPENGWNIQYVEGAKKYLIIVDNFMQAQGISFAYNMNLPKIEVATEHIAKFEVYDENRQLANTSLVTILQEAERFDIYSDEKLQAEMVISQTKELEIGNFTECTINVKNVSGEDINNVMISLDIPENLRIATKNVVINNVKEYIVQENNKLKISDVSLAKDGILTINTNMELMEYIQENLTINGTVNFEGEQIEISNKINTVKPSEIKTSITSDKIGKNLEANEEIKYTITLKNAGKSHSKIDIIIPDLENINITKVETLNKTTGAKTGITATHLSGNIASLEINPNDTIEIYITGKVKEIAKESIATIYADIVGDKIEDTTTERISNGIQKCDIQKTNNNIEVLSSNTIKGIAWIDRNENGQKDSNEMLLKGIQAILIDTTTSEQLAEQITNNNGEYNFKNLPEGNYVVEFRYNTSALDVTEYKSTKAPANLSSGVITTTQDNVTTARTEVVKVENGKSETINAGFIVNKNFDMGIKKGITKVTVNNEQGTNTYDFNNSDMAKVEVDGKYLKGSVILIQYEIEVVNTGEVAGYVKVISDKIPDGMKFTSELNTDWYEGNDGNLYSEALANQKIQPGETKTLKLVLVKEMTDDKIVSPVNTVSIEETYNEYLIADSKLDNNSSEATIIISLTTGSYLSYLWLIAVVVAIIGIGTFSVIKILKNKKI